MFTSGSNPITWTYLTIRRHKDKRMIVYNVINNDKRTYDNAYNENTTHGSLIRFTHDAEVSSLEVDDEFLSQAYLDQLIAENQEKLDLYTQNINRIEFVD